MSRQAKTVLTDVIADPLEFAGDGSELSGSVPVAQLARLHDLLAEVSGEISWVVNGSVEQDAGGSRYFLDLELEGSLQLVCQRCLGACAHKVALFNRLELIAPGAPWPDEELEDDSCDAIEAGRNLEILPLVEDEILLGLPQSPRHEDCTPPGEAGVGKEGKPSPFAALAGLKSRSGGN